MIYTILNETTGITTEDYYRDLDVCRDDCLEYAEENPGTNFAIIEEWGVNSRTIEVYGPGPLA
jgi:hypothetical protein